MHAYIIDKRDSNGVRVDILFTVLSCGFLQVVFEAQKRGGTRNDIALDDISMTPGPCDGDPVEPTVVPTPTAPPPVPCMKLPTPPNAHSHTRHLQYYLLDDNIEITHP